MSKKTTNAAKKSEEAIREAEKLNRILESLENLTKEVVNMKQKASKKVVEAKKEAKQSTKKSKVIETDEINELVDKKLILDYLQKNALTLYKKLDKVRDIRFEDDPPRVVLVVSSGTNMEKPELIHKGIKLNVEVEEKLPPPVLADYNEENEGFTVSKEESPIEQTEHYHKSITGKSAETLRISEAVGPHSSDIAKRKESYDAWRKRHKAVKIR